MIRINAAKNAKFYDSYIPCDCMNCQNFYAQIKSTCKELSDFFLQNNIDIEKPYELVSIELNNETEYISCQYLVFGECSDDYNIKIGNIVVKKEIDGHPSTDSYEQPNFVLDFSITLPNIIKK
ncbi:MAG: hypothetical protein NC131_14100 [Roseburia sp.]|nr:hypothetical protein [Roseburia sp.]